MKIGIIGFGKMGSAIGARLVACNHELISWSRDQRKVEASKIVAYASIPRKFIDQSDTIISILAYDAATERAYFGAGGICEARLDGKVILEMCTALPERVRQLCHAVHSAGGAFLEFSVGGTVKPALDGVSVGIAA